MKDNTFREIPPVTEYGFWMGLASGDIDNDGDQDLFFTNTGNTIETSILKGDLREGQILNPDWVLLRNDGDFNFREITKDKNLSGYEFAWGANFEDLNLDGYLDLVVVENYIKWPIHKVKKLTGRTFLQSEKSFLPVTDLSKTENRHYGIMPMISDFNQDGYPDIIFVNLDGPARALLSNGGKNHFLKVFLPDNVSSLGARVNLFKTDGTIFSRQKISGIGLLSDQSSDLIFGLGQDLEVKKVEVIFPSGIIKTIMNPKIDARVIVK